MTPADHPADLSTDVIFVHTHQQHVSNEIVQHHRQETIFVELETFPIGTRQGIVAEKSRRALAEWQLEDIREASTVPSSPPDLDRAR